MCTAATYQTKDHYFGRNLDLEYSYLETVTITPRNYPFLFKKEKSLKNHYAMIGMAFVQDGYPLYYDATNEYGLSMAGLNFPGNAYYHEEQEGKENIAPFEFIPWILCQCKTVEEARTLLSKMNLVAINYSEELPASPLHWIVADKEKSIVVESVKEGLKVYDNPVGVLTNNPTFDMQLFQLNNYMYLSTEPVENHFSKDLALNAYSRGMGAMGLPGDLSSQSRFVKVAFTKMNSLSKDTEEASVSQFFHILSSVEQQRGCVHMGEDKYEITIYSSCCNVDKGIYYYRTYDNWAITAVDMHQEDLEGDAIISYPLLTEPRVFIQNQK